MAWIIVAAVLNTVWTVWCAQLLPPRVATHFGLGGQANGWMSRKGFALFSILFPLALSVFIVFMGGTAGGTQVAGALGTAMEHIAAGLILFFSFLTWCIVRSNKRNPPRIDYPSLLVSVAALLVFVSLSVGGLSKASAKPDHASPIPGNSLR